MKKALSLLLSLALAFSLAACGGGGGNNASSESPSPTESSKTPSGETGVDESRYYGIGEAAEYEKYRITINKVERVDDTSIFWNPKEGYNYIKVYVIVENIGAEPTTVDETPLCIVRDGDYDAELSDYSRNADVKNFLQDGIFEEAYLAPGETESGWLTFQIKPDEKELTMKYDQLFDTVFFRFTVDTSATTESTAQQTAPEAAGGTENESVVGYTGFSIDEITGTYNVTGMGKSNQFELFTSDDMLTLRFSDGTEVEYEYDLAFGVATRYAEFDDGHTVLTILTFTRGENTIYIAVDESLTYADGSTKTGSYEGSKVD